MSNLNKTPNMAKVFSPAKVNLFLAITGKRNDGYHNIFSANFNTTFGDKITVSETSVRDEVCIEKGGISFDCKNNTIISALKLFKEAAKIDKFFQITINKNIPLEAGFGGGSSNGAVILQTMNKLYGNVLEEKKLLELGKKIGSDCMFFFKNAPSIITGIGDVASEIDKQMRIFLQNYDFFIFKPDFGISSKMAYEILKTNFYQLYVDEKDAMEKFYRLRDAIISENIELPLYNTFSELFFSQHGNLKKLWQNLKYSGTNAMLTGSGSGFFCLTHKSIKNHETMEMIKNYIGENGFVAKCDLVL